jgi:hypothetical protein
MPESRKLGTVVTFYSWKGGVGRTMALANTAVQLARSGHDVLMIDWDLEAPGLDRYFFRGQDLEAKYIEVSPAREPGGLLALLSTARQRSDGRLGAEEWPRVTATIRLQPAEATSTMPYAPLPGRLDLIASGDGADGYADQLGTFSWTSFYAESRGGQWVEEARRQWISSYDFVLIDSRTGLSDIGGICTIQLPDTLVLVFVANDQSFDGGTRVVKAAQRARRNFGYDRGQLTVVPLLSRWCGDEETDIAKVWLRRFDKDLSVQVASWLPKMFSPREFLEKVRVPHVARFTFGEPLPVLTHSLTDPMFPGLAFDLLCRLLASNMAEVGKIIDPNYEPKISIAPDTEDHEPLWRGEGLRVYISAVSSEFGQARDALESDLQNIGISSRWIGYFPASSGRTALQLLHDYIRECNVVICLVGAKSGACPSDAEI